MPNLAITMRRITATTITIKVMMMIMRMTGLIVCPTHKHKYKDIKKITDRQLHTCIYLHA